MSDSDPTPGETRGDAAWLRDRARQPDREEAQREVATRTDALIQATGAGLQLADSDLSRLDLSRLDLRAANLSRTVLHGADLTEADLRACTLICPGLEKVCFKDANLQGAYVHALAAQVCDFRGADLGRLVDATGAMFHGCAMQAARLDQAMLSGTSFYQCTLDGASLVGAQLQSCQFTECSCVATSFERADLDHAGFGRTDMRSARLAEARGTGLVLQRLAGIHGLVLEAAHLPELRVLGVRGGGVLARGLSARGSDWQRCSLTDLSLDGADLSDSSWIDVSAPAARLVGALLDGARWVRVQLDGGDLTNARGENWSVVDSSAVGARMVALQARCLHVRNSDWRDVDLSGAYLYRAMLTGDPPQVMCLAGANLAAAVIVQAYLCADLRGADLRGISGAYARLNQSWLDDARLEGARLFQASLVKTHLHRAALQGVEPPMFADRCPGLLAALESDDPASRALQEYLRAMQAVLASARRGST
jgi:uncharacterized protein YjbI with pentapeptide repeats